MNAVVDYINVHRDRYVDELKRASPSPVSARCRSIPATFAELPNGPPMPCAPRDEQRPPHRHARKPGRLRRLAQCPGKPTILFYGHYDVQPVDPVNLWTSPPFEATVRDGEIYARGAADDKGQVFMHIKAIEAY